MAHSVIGRITRHYLEAVIGTHEVSCVVADPALSELIIECRCESTSPLLLHYAK